MAFNLYRQRVRANQSNSEFVNDEISQTIKDEFHSMPNYYQAYKNGNNEDLLDVVINEGDKDDKVLGYKKLISYPYDTPQFSCGDLIYWNNEIWLLTTLDKQYLYGVKGRIIQCNNTLSFTHNSTTYSIPCVLTSLGQNVGLNINTTQYISDIGDEILVRVQKNSITQLIGIDNVFTIGRGNWKVTNISDVLEPNILIFKMKWVAESPTPTIDDTTTESEQGNITYILSSTNQPDNEIRYNVTKAYTAKKYVDDVEVGSAEFTFSIVASGVPTSAYTLTTINSNSCSIKCNSFSHSVVLRATDTATSNYIEKTIKLKSLL